jgi:hypothetical protein
VLISSSEGAAWNFAIMEGEVAGGYVVVGDTTLEMSSWDLEGSTLLGVFSKFFHQEGV